MNDDESSSALRADAIREVFAMNAKEFDELRVRLQSAKDETPRDFFLRKAMEIRLLRDCGEYDQ